MRQRCTGDAGAALAVVLAFALVVSLGLIGLLAVADTGLRAARAATEQRAASYAADGALTAAVREAQRQRDDGPFDCAAFDYSVSGLNGTSSRVRCATSTLAVDAPTTSTATVLTSVTTSPTPTASPSSSASASPSGTATSPPVGSEVPAHAVLTLAGTSVSPIREDGVVIGSSSDNAKVRLQGDLSSNSSTKVGTNSDVVLQGNWYAAGRCDGRPITGSQDCGTDATETTRRRGSDIDPRYDALVGAHGTTPVRPAAASIGSCPATGELELPAGRWYDDASVLNARSLQCDVRLLPGTHYFDFINSGSHTWEITSKRLLAGARSSNGGCSTADGAQLVFGGDSRLLSKDKGHVELCGRAKAGGPRIAVYGFSADLDGACLPATTPCGRGAAVSGTSWSDLDDAKEVSRATPTYASYKVSEGTDALRIAGFSTSDIPSDATLLSATLNWGMAPSADTAGMTVTARQGDASLPVHACSQGKNACKNNGYVGGNVDVRSLVPDLAAARSLTVDFTPVMNKQANDRQPIAALKVDGATLTLTWMPATMRGSTGCVSKAPYVQEPTTTSDPATCAVLRTDGNATLLVHGTVYTPRAVVDLQMPNQSPGMLRIDRGVVSRALWIKDAAAETTVCPVELGSCSGTPTASPSAPTSVTPSPTASSPTVTTTVSVVTTTLPADVYRLSVSQGGPDLAEVYVRLRAGQAPVVLSWDVWR